MNVLFSAITTKELEKIGPLLNQIPNSEIYLTTFDFPKAATLEELKERLHVREAGEYQNWRQAIQVLQKKMGKEDILLITGSLYFLSDVRRYLLQQNIV
ncbi:hypothetical protein LZ578_08835 [Jeotgalibaca sp. MA1X17-3]|uniref:hypothetical protein n=1 Tax=Jeotgalibaca sp. MA1X17-3 TaxID=2908211 RepID=UPI001F48B488|nr:hypothetical protein [Jeotgalibaca sp. MA1X17-3]UJF15102.1 hypothetical protein LZ578_08835 [Jeotgalibaca sp. MA1X17-3]